MVGWGLAILSSYMQAGLMGLWLVTAVLILRPGARWRARLLLLGVLQFLVPPVFTVPLYGPAPVAEVAGPTGASGYVDVLAAFGIARLVGVLVGLALLARAVRGLRRTLTAADRVDGGPVHDALQEVAAGQRVATPALYLTESAGPGTIGIRRPAVLLPRSLARTLDPDALRMVLAHEVAHIARRDPLIAVARGLAVALWWFHPVAWIVARMQRAAAEDACDDVAAATTDPAVYCDALLASARVAGAARPAGLSAALGGHPLGRRFRRLLGPHRHGLLERLARRAGPDAAAGVLVAIATAAFIAAPTRFLVFQRPHEYDPVVRVEQVEQVTKVRVRVRVR